MHKANILLNDDHTPIGGKWTFDTDNRKSILKIKSAECSISESTLYSRVEYVESHFSTNLGEVSKCNFYPLNFDAAQDWFTQFLNYRFYDFGVYEDAIVKGELLLNHGYFLLDECRLFSSTGVSQSVEFAEKNNIPINSTEGYSPNNRVERVYPWCLRLSWSFERTMNFEFF